MPTLTEGKIGFFTAKKGKSGGHSQHLLICVTFMLCAAKNSLSSDTSVILPFFTYCSHMFRGLRTQ